MRYVTQVGLCCAVSLGLVAAALGQRSGGGAAGAAGASGGVGAPQGGVDLQSGPGPSPPEQRYINAQPELARTRDQMHRGRPQVAPIPDTQTNGATGINGTQQNRTAGSQSSAMAGGQRGELGVYMVAGGGRGVEVSRITPGSAAEQAGLREGDVILQVNGRDAMAPQETAQMIRQVPVGQSVSLTIMRDGNRQQVQATMRPARQRREMTGDLMDRDPYQVGFRGENESASSAGESTLRVRQLEQQVSSLQQELQTMRQEITQLRSAGGATSAGGISAGGQGLTPPTGAGSDLSAPSAGAATGAAAPPSPFGTTDRGAAGSTSTTTSGAGGASTSGAASTPSASDRSGAAGSTSGAGGSASGAAGSTSGTSGSTSGGAGSTSGNTSSGAAGSTSGAGISGAGTSGAGTLGAAGSSAGTSGVGSSTSGAGSSSPASGSSSKTGSDSKSSTDDLFGK